MKLSSFLNFNIYKLKNNNIIIIIIIINILFYLFSVLLPCAIFSYIYNFVILHTYILDITMNVGIFRIQYKCHEI